MCQFLFKISYHGAIFKFRFRNGDKVMSALKIWQYLRERKMVKLHSWLFYSNPQLLFLITIKKKNLFVFLAIFPGHVHFNFCNGYAMCKSTLGCMALREPQGTALLALSYNDKGSAQHMAPDLFFILQVGLWDQRIYLKVSGLLLISLQSILWSQSFWLIMYQFNLFEALEEKTGLSNDLK